MRSSIPRRNWLTATCSAIALIAGLSSPGIAGGAAAAPEDPAPIDRMVSETVGRTSALIHIEAGSSFRQGLSAAERAGLDVGTHYRVINVFVAYGEAAAFEVLSEQPPIAYIEANRPVELSTDTSHKATRGHKVLAGRIKMPNGDRIDGRGVGVAVVDSGVDGTHPDLRNRMGGNVKIVCSTPFVLDTAECHGPKQFVALDDTDHASASGHGTHVAGTVAGTGAASDGRWHGAAPGATLYGVSVGTAISVENALDGLAWVLENHDEVRPQIKVVNNSWGSKARANVIDDATRKLQNALIAEGITVVFAAGNDGGETDRTRTSPQCTNPTPGVICVGNYNDGDKGTRSGKMNRSSSRGKADDPSSWPDLSAPGTDIVAACRVTLPVCNAGTQPVLDHPNHYSALTGTSMAAPHVSGIAAQLYQVNPRLTPAEIEDILEDTAHKFEFGPPYTTDPFNPDSASSPDKGHGLVDALAALRVVRRRAGQN